MLSDLEALVMLVSEEFRPWKFRGIYWSGRTLWFVQISRLY